MANIASILAEKGSEVLSVSKSTTVLEAARMMTKNKCGSLLVTQDTKLLGIITERDVLSRVVALELAPTATPVAAVMSKEISVCNVQTSVDEARTLMRNLRIRHLPVVDDAENIIGLISIGDLNASQLEGQQQAIHQMHEYIYGQTLEQ
ncbi:MAG: CBS domain-containing protein [Phycisphaeraceae bacterium]|nr:CBS domain-containing protein [Phycisphaeraceae bacterium]